MKKIIGLTLITLMVLILSSCLKDDCQAVRKFVRLDPIYVQPAQFRNAKIQSTEERSLENPGKSIL